MGPYKSAADVVTRKSLSTFMLFITLFTSNCPRAASRASGLRSVQHQKNVGSHHFKVFTSKPEPAAFIVGLLSGRGYRWSTKKVYTGQKQAPQAVPVVNFGLKRNLNFLFPVFLLFEAPVQLSQLLRYESHKQISDTSVLEFHISFV